MNKKSFLFIFLLIMFIGINVHAVKCSDYQATTATCKPKTGYSQDDCKVGSCDSTKCTSGSYNSGCKSGAGDCTNSNGTCTCPSVDKPSISGCTGTYSTNGGSGPSCQIGGYNSNYEYSVSPASAASISGSTVTAKKIDSSTCKVQFTITAKNSNDCGSEETATTSGTAMVPWGGAGGKRCYAQEISRATAEANNWNRYTSGCASGTPQCGSEALWCDTISRGCGSNPPVPQPHCYDIGYGLLEWHLKEKVVNNQLQDNMPSGWKIAKDDNGNELTKDQCYTVFKCSTKYPGADTKDTSCNSTADFNGTYVKKCGIQKGVSIGEDFYKIECNETMKTGFNGPIFNDSNYPNSFMYPGTAFKFNYIAKTKVSCEGKWHEDFYQAAEAYVKRRASDKIAFNADTDDETKSEPFFNSALDGVHNVKTSYQNWKLNYFNTSFKSENGKIFDTQPSISGKTKDEKEYSLDLVDGYKTAVNTCGSEPNGQNKDFTYQVAYTIEMQMPILYYSDSQTPQYTTTETSGYKLLGRVFPISDIKEYANRDDYKYSVNISNLGLGHKWSNNETCSIAIKDKEIVFRSINLNDPFIQQLDSDHQIGENWKNSKFDFTNIIDKNTWSNPSQYNQVRIDEQVGKLIKEELSKQYASYLGSCSKGTDKGTTPQICALYKQAIAGKE